MDDTRLREALSLVEAGQAHQAEALVAQGARDAAIQAGPNSLAYAAAELDHAHVLLELGNEAGAAAALERAARAEPTDDEHAQLRLTALTNRGELLVGLGRLDEARAALDEALRGREARYGTRHVAYAIGLLPRVALAMAEDQAGPALEDAERALAIFWHEGHPRVAAAMALRAEAVKRARGLEAPAFDRLLALPPELQDEVLTHALGRAPGGLPEPTLAVLDELERTLLTAPRADLELGPLVAEKARAARRAGAHGPRQAALRWLIRRAESVDDLVEAVQGHGALSIAFDDAGEFAAAEHALREAARLAALLGDPVVEARVARERGLWLSARGRAEEAVLAQREGLRHARRVAVEDPRGSTALARAELALALALPSDARDEIARLLADALAKLDPTHPEALVARGELDALLAGPTHDYLSTLTAALRAILEPRAPAGLVAGVRLALDPDGELDVSIQLSRAATPVEERVLERAVGEASTELRAMMRAQASPRG